MRGDLNRLPARALQPIRDTVDDNVRLRAALEEAQWGSCDGCGQMNHCPLCGASRLGPDEDANGMQLPGAHLDSCPIGAALKSTS